MCQITLTYLNQTPIFEWYVIRFSSKNKYQKDMCLKESELHAQNMITILGSIVSIMGYVHDHLMSIRIFTLMTNKICI